MTDRLPITSTLEYVHGKETCAWKPGEFCRFVGSKSFGTKPWCMLFDSSLFEEAGWLQRCPECKGCTK